MHGHMNVKEKYILNIVIYNHFLIMETSRVLWEVRTELLNNI
jgi:hypothetical protein